MNPNVRERIEYYLQLLLSSFDPNYKLEFTQEGDQWRINIISALDKELLIGDKSETLVAIQHILRTLIHKNIPADRTHFILDVLNYRRERENSITNKLPDLLQRFVIKEGKSIVLTGLSSYERLLIHHYLVDVNGIHTLSVGVSSNRKLLIMPSGNAGTTGGLENAIVIDLEKLMREPQKVSAIV